LETGDVDIVCDAEAEVAVVEADIGDDGVGGVGGESAPDTGVEVDRVCFVRSSGDGPGAAEYVLAGSGLLAGEGADIDGAGRAGDGKKPPP